MELLCHTAYYFHYVIPVAMEILIYPLLIQIVQEKQRFRKNPFNYAMKKNQLLRKKVAFTIMIFRLTYSVFVTFFKFSFAFSINFD